ncbi:hypothetical protein FB468_0615 [Leucobacter komagatae]|uniref:Uncharacterized protein n=2 Tax=Leucobacter komagatae TaxID=55969 RepID=A0A542Y3H3_9MICO|nr:hypothetical protein FB468_0615 [Leucobacter komagatae]
MKKRQQRPLRPDPYLETFDAPIEKDTSARLIDEWSGTRSGGWASRGFDFQHTIAAWLAARLIAGDLQAHALVPEGLEDVSIESETSRHVQVKSRAEHLGAFPVGIASNHIVDAWVRHRDRDIKADTLTVVLERGVKGESGLGEFDTPLDKTLDQDSTLRARIATVMEKRGLSETDLQELLDQTSVYGVSWVSIDESNRFLLGKAFEKLSPAALNYLARELRVVVAETTNLNAQAVNYADRYLLDRSELAQRSQHFIEQVDLDALESAITLGICSPLVLSEELHDDRFYEGVATQPGHVAAGLVVPRTDLIGEAVTGIQETSSVILTGPSGVGKSALLWSVPHALPGVLWFRVNRLSPADVAEVLRLCRSHRVSDRSPIGLLIDDAGKGQFSGWSQLREEAAATPGLFIISTARHEDLLSLGDLSGNTTITVSLDESGAEAIFSGLRDRNATDSPHWKEAFEQAEGLTLEFTHLLTRGERLSAVIGDQVRRRVSERRNVELELLSLSATADRWSATLPVDKAAEACGVSQYELKEPLARLTEEHLLVERNGTISGVHQLRSAAISNVIHDLPPPTLEHTISRLLSALAPDQIRRFIPNALRDEPQIGQLIHHVAQREYNDAVKLTAYLRGLRIFDFYERAVNWIDIAERHGIPPANQPVSQLCAITGTVLPDFFPEEFNQAVSDMVAAPESSRGSALISAIGSQRLAEVLVKTDDVDLANELLFEFQGSEIDVVTEFRSALTPSSPLIEAMQRASITQIANILATANSLDSKLAQTLVESCDGEPAIIAEFRSTDPWIIDLRIDESEDEAVAFARVLHISDEIHGDPHDRVIALGRLLLRCFPRTKHVDVKLVLPGGHDYQIREHQLGATKLRREYDHSELKVSWNQERMQVTKAVLGATDTERLAAALPLIEAASRLTRVVGNAFTAADVRHVDTNQLADEINTLGDGAKQIGPSLNGRPRALDIKAEQEPGTTLADPLSGIVTDLTGNVFPRLTKLDNPAALAAHLSDQVIAKSLYRAQQEPWYLLGYDKFPDSLAALETDLHRLLAVVAELAADSSANQALVRAARAGRHEGALGRAADAARTRARRRLQARKSELEQIGKTIGWRFRAYMSKDDHYQLVPERLITLDVLSLIEWSQAVEVIGAALQASGLPGEKFLLVPLRNGRPVESLAMTLISSLLPAGTLGSWTAQLAQPHKTQLTVVLDETIASVQIASGVLALSDSQRTHGAVVKVMEDARQRFVRSKRFIDQVPSDSIIAQVSLFLEDLESQLQSEEVGESVGGGIASQFLRMVTQGHQTEMTSSMSMARLMALEWDIDRDAAPRIFDLN